MAGVNDLIQFITFQHDKQRASILHLFKIAFLNLQKKGKPKSGKNQRSTYLGRFTKLANLLGL